MTEKEFKEKVDAYTNSKTELIKICEQYGLDYNINPNNITITIGTTSITLDDHMLSVCLLFFAEGRFNGLEEAKSIMERKF